MGIASSGGGGGGVRVVDGVRVGVSLVEVEGREERKSREGGGGEEGEPVKEEEEEEGDQRVEEGLVNSADAIPSLLSHSS